MAITPKPNCFSGLELKVIRRTLTPIIHPSHKTLTCNADTGLIARTGALFIDPYYALPPGPPPFGRTLFFDRDAVKLTIYEKESINLWDRLKKAISSDLDRISAPKFGKPRATPRAAVVSSGYVVPQVKGAAREESANRQ